jgi:hypothetical protein
MGEAIHYEDFQELYNASREEIDGLVEMIRRYRPGLPIFNCTIEWAVLKQRDLEAQDSLAQEIVRK